MMILLVQWDNYIQNVILMAGAIVKVPQRRVFWPMAGHVQLGSLLTRIWII